MKKTIILLLICFFAKSQTVNWSLQLAGGDNSWHSSNATKVPLVRQMVLNTTTGQYKIGDGVTQLQNLSYNGGSSSGYVPYTGATGSVNLGANLLKIYGDSVNFTPTFIMEGGGSVNGANPDILLKGYYNSRVMFQNSISGGTWYLQNNITTGTSKDAFFIGNSTNTGLSAIRINSTSLVNIANNLRVGSLTTAPSATLDVTGTASISSSGTVAGGVVTPSVTSTGQLNLMAPTGQPVVVKVNNVAQAQFYANEQFLTGKVMVNSVLTPVANMHVMGTMSTQSTYSVGARILENQGADVASAAGAITLGSDGNVFEITGTSAITLISSTGWKNGSEITLLFTSTASLTDGTANSGANIGFELAGNVNFTGSSDDSITLVLCEIGGTQRWIEKCRSVN